MKYFNQAFLGGRQADFGEKTLASLLDLFPEFGRVGSRKLPRAWRCLKGWRKLPPPRLPVWAGVVSRLIEAGHALKGARVLLGLCGYLRPHELMQIRPEDLSPPTQSVMGCCSLLVCPQDRRERTKTAAADDSVTLDCNWLAWMDPVRAALASA